MHPIRFYCGNHKRFAADNIEHVLVGQTTQTDTEMSNMGVQFYKNSEFVPVNIFSNIELVLSGMRRAICKEELKENPDIQVIFYPDHPDDAVCVGKINKNAYIDQWPRGMFDQMTDDLCAIVSRKGWEKDEAGKDQGQNTTTEAS